MRRIVDTPVANAGVPIEELALAAIKALAVFSRAAYLGEHERHYRGSIESRVNSAALSIREFMEIVAIYEASAHRRRKTATQPISRT